MRNVPIGHSRIRRYSLFPNNSVTLMPLSKPSVLRSTLDVTACTLLNEFATVLTWSSTLSVGFLLCAGSRDHVILHTLERTISMSPTLFESVARFAKTSTSPKVGSALLGLPMDPVHLTGTKTATKRTTTSPLTTTLYRQLDIPSPSFVSTHLPFIPTNCQWLHLHPPNLLLVSRSLPRRRQTK